MELCFFVALQFKVLFMDTSSSKSLDALQDIKKMMERSSRFISLSGWSGVSAGMCALIGAWLAYKRIEAFKVLDVESRFYSLKVLREALFIIAVSVFICALIFAFLFTYLRSRKAGVAIWSASSRRLVWNTMLPIIAGGVLILKMIDLNYYELIAPACLLFYGLALINGSKYTITEIKYLGYAQLLLGFINCWLQHYGLLLWAVGFGALHIVYGLIMWWKYERVEN